MIPTELIKILANLADEPAQTYEAIEIYINKRELQAVTDYIKEVIFEIKNKNNQ